MEYQKVINFWDDTSNQPSKFRKKSWLEVNEEWPASYKIGSQIGFKNLILKPSLFDYINAYILVSGIITITGAGKDDPSKPRDEVNKGVILENCMLLTHCISETNNTQIDHAKLDILMPMYNLIQYSNNFSEILISSW